MITNDINTMPVDSADLFSEIKSSMGDLIDEIIDREQLPDSVSAIRYILVKGSDFWEDKYSQMDLS